MDMRRQIREAVRFIRSKTSVRPKAALILGSGLGDFADVLDVQSVISSSDIPHYPRSSVQGHAGTLLFGTVREEGRTSPPLLIFRGRVHFYETNDLHQVILPTAVAAALGVRTLLVTNAAGGIHGQFRPGDLMLIRDLIQLTFENIPDLRPPAHPGDKTSARRVREGTGSLFDERLMATIRATALDRQLRLHEGTYCWLKGPTYETAAEIQMLKRIGADAVGMSTVPEIVTAHRLGMRIAGISLISNLATGISASKLSHAEVTETADRVKIAFTGFMKEVVLRLR